MCLQLPIVVPWVPPFYGLPPLYELPRLKLSASQNCLFTRLVKILAYT